MADYTVRLDGATTAKYEPILLDGVMTLAHPGTISKSADPGLYFSAEKAAKPVVTPTTLTLIPYYAWANREPASMQVWIPYGDV